YRWPGNIRELQNAIQQAVILCTGATITRADMPSRITGDHHGPTQLEQLASRLMALEVVEREYARAVLASVNGHRGEAAAILGVDRKTLTRKLEEPD
ncbi:MAG: helix-turn-helix domain-containing protein, partial [Candidatus Binatus sp.]